MPSVEATLPLRHNCCAIQGRAHFVYPYLIHAQWPLFVFFFFSQYVYTSTLSLLLLQLALRAPSSRSRGRDSVSSVHSTVAPPSRQLRCAAAATAITAATWTNRRTCAPVSQSDSAHTHTHKYNTPQTFLECDGSVLRCK